MKKLNKSSKRNLLLSVDKIRSLQQDELGRVIGGLACPNSDPHAPGCTNGQSTPP
jgi:hypothetical protein